MNGKYPNGTSKALKLSPLEWEILNHRLSEPSCLMDVFGPNGGDQHDESDVEVIATQLWDGFFDRAVGVSEVITKDILADCVDGCTYFNDCDDAVALGEWSSSQLRRRVAALDSLCEKIGQFTGRKVYPVNF